MIKNFLKNGSEIKDLNGHVVKETDAPELYRILDRIGLSLAMRDADFIITGEGSFDAKSILYRKASAAVMEMMSESDRPGCLFVGKCDLALNDVLCANPKLRGVITCPVGEEPYEDTIARAFLRDVLPLIGKDVANTRDL